MRAGWDWLANATKWHYFDKDGRSLCGRWWRIGDADAVDEDKFGSPDNCRVCERKRRTMLSRQAKAVTHGKV